MVLRVAVWRREKVSAKTTPASTQLRAALAHERLTLPLQSLRQQINIIKNYHASYWRDLIISQSVDDDLVRIAVMERCVRRGRRNLPTVFGVFGRFGFLSLCSALLFSSPLFHRSSIDSVITALVRHTRSSCNDTSIFVFLPPTLHIRI